MGSVKRKQSGEAKEDCVTPPLKQQKQENGFTMDEPVTCLHDVSYPEGYVPRPLPNLQQGLKPAREFPFTLDPFQLEAIKCLDNGESVMVFSLPLYIDSRDVLNLDFFCFTPIFHNGEFITRVIGSSFCFACFLHSSST